MKDKESFVEIMYRAEFEILRSHGRLEKDWGNVYQHCRVEAAAALVIADLLELNTIDRDMLAKAAILHDWNKRNEKESEHKGNEKYEIGVAESYKNLLKLGVEKRVVDIAHSVGHTSLNNILDSSDDLEKIMHFIDDITDNDSLVELRVRIARLEEKSQYKELNESGRKKYNGMTYFEKQKEVGLQIQKEIEGWIERRGTSLYEKGLIDLIKSKISKYL